MSDSSDGKWTRRRFLEAIGMAGGAAAVYETMTALGLINVPEAFARQPLPPNSGTGKSVVILGAGVAGLTAAYELKNAGYSVTILEAQPRIGGRNRTVRRDDVLQEITGPPQVCRFDDGLYLNAGPGRLPYHHTAVLEYCRILGVPLEVYVMMTRANLFQNSAGLDHKPAFGGQPMVNRRIANDTRGYISELLAKAINKGSLDDQLNHADKEAMLDLLTVFGDVEKKKNYVYEGSSRSGYEIEPGIVPCAEVIPKLSLNHLLSAQFWKYRFYQSEEYEWQPTLFEPVGGMDGIVKGFERHVGDLVRKERVVTRVDTYDDRVEVAHRGPGGAELTKADWCISTIPLPILDKIENNFRDDYKAAIGNVKFAVTCKVGWQANRRFWERDEQIYGGISYINHDIAQMWYPSHGYFGEKGVLTGAYNYDGAAERMGNLEFPDRLDLAMQGAQRLHPKFAEFVPKDLGLSIAWQKVPHQLGGWADDLDCKLSTYRRLVERPERRFWVAGDQVSQLSGWQEGAIRSAIHVIERIHQPALVEQGTRAPKLRAVPRREAPSTRRRTRGLP